LENFYLYFKNYFLASWQNIKINNIKNISSVFKNKKKKAEKRRKYITPIPK